MTNRMKSILVKVALAALAGAVIGVGAYYRMKDEPQKQGLSANESASLQQESQKQGKVHSVSAGGNDADPGTQEKPVRTAGAAANPAEAGDTVVTKPKSTARTSSG